MSYYEKETAFAKKIFEELDIETDIQVLSLNEFNKKEPKSTVAAFYDPKDNCVYINYKSAEEIGREYMQRNNASEEAYVRFGIFFLCIHEACHCVDEFVQSIRQEGKKVKTESIEHNRMEIFVLIKGKELLKKISDKTIGTLLHGFGYLNRRASEQIYLKYNRYRTVICNMENVEETLKEFEEKGENLSSSN